MDPSSFSTPEFLSLSLEKVSSSLSADTPPAKISDALASFPCASFKHSRNRTTSGFDLNFLPPGEKKYLSTWRERGVLSCKNEVKCSNETNQLVKCWYRFNLTESLERLLVRTVHPSRLKSGILRNGPAGSAGRLRRGPS